MSGLPGALAVVRVQLAPVGATATTLAALPQPKSEALGYASKLRNEVTQMSGYAGFVGFDTGTGLDCWIRARDVVVIDVVPTEDPSA